VKRWLLLGVALLGVLVFLMMRQLRTPAAEVAPSPAAQFAKLDLPPPPQFPVPLHEKPEEEEELFQGAKDPDQPVQKLDPKSIEFFQRFDEMIAPRLTKEAASCYRGGKQRDQKIKFSFIKHVKDGRVTLSNVKVVTSTLNDPQLEHCMFEKVANFANWKDDEFPDIDGLEDEVLIRIRALKKYQQEEDREVFPVTKLNNIEDQEEPK
jgi:hypothetical protein